MLTAAQLAEVIGTDVATLDNALALDRAISPSGTRGVSRRFSVDTAMLLSAAFLVRRDTGCAMPAALGTARRLLDSGGSAELGPLLRISLDISRLRSVVESTIADVVAASPPPRRGRPPRKTNRGAP